MLGRAAAAPQTVTSSKPHKSTAFRKMITSLLSAAHRHLAAKSPRKELSRVCLGLDAQKNQAG
jgi:hypothetical protein